jgi:hypothetical protein
MERTYEYNGISLILIGEHSTLNGKGDCVSINSKWIKDLNIRPKTLKIAQERAGNTLKAIGIGKDFLSRTPAAQQLKERMDKWDFIKLKSFCTTKEVVSKLKRLPTE